MGAKKVIKKGVKMAVQKLAVEYVGIDTIEPYEHNARKHGSKDLAAIKKSIEEFGFNDPIGIWHDQIVEGHGRLLAAQELGFDTVPIIRLDNLTDEQRRAYTLAHNKTAELSDWDFEVLAEELKDLADFDMSEFGFDLSGVKDDKTLQAEDEEDLFDDIEKQDIHYGVPYQGNKSRIADIIISILPEGKRLVDLFGGVVQSRTAPCLQANGKTIYTTI